MLLAASGLAVGAILVLSRSPLLLALPALAGTSLGFYLADRVGMPPNLIKIYLTAMFAAGFVLLGRVPQFRTEFWEYLLLLFFVGRVLLDFVRPDFELRFPFGGVGDGLFLTAGYFYFKKAFIACAGSAESVLRAALYYGLVIAVIGLFEAVTATDLLEFRQPSFLIQDVMSTGEGHIRINSMFQWPVYLGAATSLSLYLALLLYWTGRLKRVAMAGVVTVLLLVTVANLYRGIWLGLAAGLVFLFVLRPGKAYSMRMPLRLVTAILVVAVVALAAQAALKRTAIYEQRIANPENVNSRLMVYKAIMRGVTDHPWRGYGTGTVEGYLAVTPYNPTDLYTPHNGYLSIVYENGAPFLLIYLGWFFALLWRVRETNRPAMLVAGAMVTMILVANLTMYFPLSFDYHSLLLVMTAALAIGERDSLLYQEKPTLPSVHGRKTEYAEIDV
jgi:hypothetical protein